MACPFDVSTQSNSSSYDSKLDHCRIQAFPRRWYRVQVTLSLLFARDVQSINLVPGRRAQMRLNRCPGVMLSQLSLLFGISALQQYFVGRDGHASLVVSLLPFLPGPIRCHSYSSRQNQIESALKYPHTSIMDTSFRCFMCRNSCTSSRGIVDRRAPTSTSRFHSIDNLVGVWDAIPPSMNC